MQNIIFFVYNNVPIEINDPHGIVASGHVMRETGKQLIATDHVIDAVVMQGLVDFYASVFYNANEKPIPHISFHQAIGALQLARRFLQTSNLTTTKAFLRSALKEIKLSFNDIENYIVPSGNFADFKNEIIIARNCLPLEEEKQWFLWGLGAIKRGDYDEILSDALKKEKAKFFLQVLYESFPGDIKKKYEEVHNALDVQCYHISMTEEAFQINGMRVEGSIDLRKTFLNYFIAIIFNKY